jgi:hypothetical protein
VKDLYAELFRKNLTSSKRHFSTYWCSRAPNYLALGGGLSTDAKLTVFRRLIAQRQWILAVQAGWLVLFGEGEVRA